MTPRTRRRALGGDERFLAELRVITPGRRGCMTPSSVRADNVRYVKYDGEAVRTAPLPQCAGSRLEPERRRLPLPRGSARPSLLCARRGTSWSSRSSILETSTPLGWHQSRARSGPLSRWTCAGPFVSGRGTFWRKVPVPGNRDFPALGEKCRALGTGSPQVTGSRNRELGKCRVPGTALRRRTPRRRLSRRSETSWHLPLLALMPLRIISGRCPGMTCPVPRRSWSS